MPIQDNLLCPVDGIKLNETNVRLVAGRVLLTTLAYLFTHGLVLPLLLTLDFGLRSFDQRRYSPLAGLAGQLATHLRLPYKATDRAPKRFAARIGLGFGLLLTAWQLLALPTVLPAAVLAGFAALEASLGFCAGCHVYTFSQRLFAPTIRL